MAASIYVLKRERQAMAPSHANRQAASWPYQAQTRGGAYRPGQARAPPTDRGDTETGRGDCDCVLVSAY